MRTVIALLSALAFTLPAHAIDYAERLLIGFSPDARYFAFAEYGVQDGSGFPYANAYVIDTSTDAWVKGTPARILIENEESSEFDALGQALEQIDSLVDQFDIQRIPNVVAHNPITQISSDPYSVRFLHPMMQGPTDDYAYTLTLTERSMATAADCPADMGDYQGMTLTLTLPGGKERNLTEDKTVPQSRRCALGYRISEVMISPDAPVMAILLDVRLLGFEGWDRRFMAVTTALE
jgi:predicted secreted protein